MNTPQKRIGVSSGHGLHVAGAHTSLANEVLEARRVTMDICQILREMPNLSIWEYHDNGSRNQNDNLNAIINWHNALECDLNVSIHFNAIDAISPNGIGTEVLFRNAGERKIASQISTAIASASGLRNRGAKHRTNIRILNMVNKPIVLVEVCFINSDTDIRLYRQNYFAICNAIAKSITEAVI